MEFLDKQKERGGKSIAESYPEKPKEVIDKPEFVKPNPFGGDDIPHFVINQPGADVLKSKIQVTNDKYKSAYRVNLHKRGNEFTYSVEKGKDVRGNPKRVDVKFEKIKDKEMPNSIARIGYQMVKEATKDGIEPIKSENTLFTKEQPKQVTPTVKTELTQAEKDDLDQIEAFPENTAEALEKKIAFANRMLDSERVKGIRKLNPKDADEIEKVWGQKLEGYKRKLAEVEDQQKAKNLEEEHTPSASQPPLLRGELKSKDKVKQTKAFGEVKISDITKKLKDYQGRQGEDYSEQTFNRIVNDVKNGTLVFDALPPIQLYERKDGELELLAGHSRLAAFEYLNKEGIEYKGRDFSEIRSQIIRESDGVSFEQAKKIAQESNQGAVQKPTDNAGYLRGLRDKGKFADDSEQKARAEDLYGKSGAPYVIELSYLNPKGKTMQMLRSLVKSGDKDLQGRVESIASWNGFARKKFGDMLTNKHEDEMFDWLMDENNFKMAKTKTEFSRRVQDVVDKPEFDPRKPLNLPKRESLSNAELEYRRRVSELEGQIRGQEKALKDKRAELVKRKQTDSPKGAGSITNADINRVLEPIRTDILDLQDSLEKLRVQEGKYKAAGEAEGGLFGAPSNSGEARDKTVFAASDNKIGKVKDEIDDIEKEIIKAMGKLPAFYDPNLALLTSKLISKYIQIGYYRIEQLARQMVARGMEKLLPYLQEAYNKFKKDGSISPEILNSLSDENEINGFKHEGFAERISKAERQAILSERELSAADRAKGGDKRPPLRYANGQNLPDVAKEHVVEGKYDIDEHQRYAVNLALNRFENGGRAFLLADGPGVGKTRELLVVANEYKKVVSQGKSLPILIVTESDRIIKDSFVKDAAALNIGLSDFEIGTFSDLRRGIIGKQEKYGLVIYDEAHNLKNAETGKAKAAGNVMSNSILFVTATPMDKPASAIYFIGEIADAGAGEVSQLLGLRLVYQANMFGGESVPVVEKIEGVNESDVIEKIIDLRNKAISAGAMIRREYPFFGTVKDSEYRLDNTSGERQDAIFEHYKDKIKGVFRSRSLSEREKKDIGMKLGQKRSSELHRFTESLKADQVYAESVKDINDGKQVIYAAEYVNDSVIESIGIEVESSLSQLKRKLEKDGIKYAELYGGNKKKNREAMVKFQTGQVQALLMTYRSGGVGINLDDVEGTSPRVMYVLSPSHGGDMLQQVIGRVSRRNTQSPASVKLVYFEDSINDNRRRQIIAGKMRTLFAIQEGEDIDRARLEEEETLRKAPSGQGVNPKGVEGKPDVRFMKRETDYGNLFVIEKALVEEMKRLQRRIQNVEFVLGADSEYYRTEKRLGEVRRELVKVRADISKLKPEENEFGNDQMAMFMKKAAVKSNKAKIEAEAKRQTDTAEFKKWFGDSKVVDADGKPLVVYSGHSNIALYGNEYDSKKSTSGGFYASESPEVASGYALGKWGNREYYENGSQYRLKGKNGEFNKKISQYKLNEEQLKKLEEYKNLTEDEYDTKANNLGDMDYYIKNNKDYDKDVRRWGITGGSDNLQNIFDFFEQQGYNIAYLSDQNLPSDVRPPEFLRQTKNDFEELLDYIGVEWQSYDWMQPGIYPIYLKIENPINADKPFPSDLLTALKDYAKGKRNPKETDFDYTYWTKDYNIKSWVEDIENNREGWTTQIPKSALPIIKQYGYDGIKEWGSKGLDLPREKRQINWIAFEPGQIKSATGNSGAFDAGNADIRFMRGEDEKFNVDGRLEEKQQSIKTRLKDISKYADKKQELAKLWKGDIAEVKIKTDNETFTVEKGNSYYGAAKIIAKHFGVDLTLDDLLKLPEVLKNGKRERSYNGRDQIRFNDKGNGLRYTAVINARNEIINYYTDYEQKKNRKFGNDSLSLRFKKSPYGDLNTKIADGKTDVNAKVSTIKIKAVVGVLDKAIGGVGVNYVNDAEMLELQKRYGNEDSVPHYAFALLNKKEVYINTESVDERVGLHSC